MKALGRVLKFAVLASPVVVIVALLSQSDRQPLETFWAIGVVLFPVILVYVVGVVAMLRETAQDAYDKLAIPEGHCQTCGYDLRATPDCCPECGTIPAPPARAGGSSRGRIAERSSRAV